MGTPLLIAHRGVSKRAPENTLASFRLAWSEGTDGIECDVHLTRDGKVVCIHDGDTQRVAGIARVVKKTAWSDLRELDAGSWKGAAFAGERLPLLSDVLAEMPQGSRIFVELKIGPEIVEPFLAVLDESPVDQSMVTVIAFDAATVAESKRLRPELAAYWLTHFKRSLRGGFSPSVESILATLAACAADGLGAENHAAVDERLVRALKERNLGLNIWTVDDRARVRELAALGADSLTSNDPRAILGL